MIKEKLFDYTQLAVSDPNAIELQTSLNSCPLITTVWSINGTDKLSALKQIIWLYNCSVQNEV